MAQREASHEISVDESIGVIVVAYGRSSTVESICASIDEVAAIALETGIRRLIADFRLEPVMKSELDQISMVTHLVSAMPRSSRIATVFRDQSQLDKVRISELAAQNRRLHLKAVTTMDAAMAWVTHLSATPGSAE